MFLLADKNKIKFKSWTSASKPGTQPRDISRTASLAGTYLGFMALIMGFATIYNIYGGENVSAGSISVSISGDIDLGLVTNDETGTAGESSAATVSVTSTDAGGYTLMLAGENSEGKLVGTDSSNYFSSISDTVKESTFASSSSYNNQWGLLPSVYNGIANDVNDPYLYRVPMGDNLAMIDSTNSANLNPNTYTLAVAARANSNTAIDTYSNSFVVSATGNATNYSISYENPAEWPGTQIGSTDGSTVTLSSVTPKMNGYTFNGWCSESVAAGSACTGTTYQPGGTYSLSSGANATLYATWVSSCNGTSLKYNNRQYCFTNTTTNFDNKSTSACSSTDTSWKFPSKGELDELITAAGSGSQLYNALGLSNDRAYWSDTDFVTSNMYAWRLNVSASETKVIGSDLDKTYTRHIMCVQ